jgi:hypothetical protein
MKIITFCVLALSLQAGRPVDGQDLSPQKEATPVPSPQPGISAAEVLEKYLAATGGVEARQALKSMESAGRFGLEGFHEKFRLGGLGDFHFYFKAPDNDALEFEHAQGGLHGYTWIGHNSGKIFLRQTVRSNWAISGVTVQSVEEAWLALGEWDFNRRYTQISLAGRSNVNGKPAYALLFKPREGDPDIRYFDAETFLLVRMDQVGRFREKDGPETKTRIESYYSDYQDTHGIKFPRLVVAIGNPQSLATGNPQIVKSRLEFVVSELKVNSNIDDRVFKKD